MILVEWRRVFLSNIKKQLESKNLRGVNQKKLRNRVYKRYVVSNLIKINMCIISYRYFRKLNVIRTLIACNMVLLFFVNEIILINLIKIDS